MADTNFIKLKPVSELPIDNNPIGGHLLLEQSENEDLKRVPISVLNIQVQNIAELKTMIGANNGDIITLLGYYKAGDKEPLNYKWTTTQGVDDGGSVINSGSGSWLAAFSEIIKPEDFGAKGDGIQNDTEYIQKALNYNFKNINFTKTYLIDNIYINNKINSNIFSQNATLILNPAKTTNVGLEMRNLDNCNIYGFKIQGNDTNAPYCRGIYSASGYTIKNVNIYNNYVDNCSTGISVNADLSGTLYNINIYNNVINNTRGTDAGYGYGIHCAHGDYSLISNVNIYNNSIINSGRHSIYCAKGKGYNIYNNTIYKHRFDYASSSDPRAAINIARVSNVKCYNNRVYGGNSCALMISSAELIYTDTIENIDIYNNDLSNINNIHTFYIGYLSASSFAKMKNINIYNNIITSTDISASAMQSYYGLNVSIYNNVITSKVNGIAFRADSDSSATNTYSNNISVYGNEINTDGNPFRFGDLATSTVSLNIYENKYSFSGNVFITSVNITNPNISVFDRLNRVSGLTFSAGVTLKQNMFAAASIYGYVKQSTSVTNSTAADATDLTTAITLVNELKAKLNAKLAADRASGQQA